MSDWMSGLFGIAILIVVVAVVLLKPILAATTTPPNDLTQIKANLEGPAGEAGPSMRVVDIKRDGIRWSRSRSAARSYQVTLQRPDGSTQQRTVQIEATFLGQGDLSLDPPWRRPSSDGVTGRPRASLLRGALALVVGGLVMAGLYIVPALPFISEAKGQLRYVLHRDDIRIVQLYSAGRFCGVYKTSDDRRPMRFLIDDGKVWTGSVLPGGPRHDAPYDSTDPYDQWSRCMINSKGGRGDEGFAIWVLNRFS